MDDIVSIANAEIEMFERPSVATSRLLISRLESAEQINKEMRDALESIAEYWNGGVDSRDDALEYIIELADKTSALAKAGGEL